MPKRRKYARRGKLKLKLRKNTIYTIFGVGVVLSGIILALSFTGSGGSFIYVNDMLKYYFGGTSILLPALLVFFGLLFLRLKFFLARPHVSVGFLILVLSLATLFRSGFVGEYVFLRIAEVISGAGTYLVSLAGIFIGLFVFFDTSVDEIVRGIAVLRESIGRFIPKAFVSYFKKRNVPNLGNKPLTIRQGAFPAVANKDMTAAPKKDEFISEKLVSNTMSSGLIWEYPPLTLLNEGGEHKADRGDIKEIAGRIEKTLQSFGITAKVVEVNLGPAVTQYALEIALGTKVSKITSLANDLALATEAPTGQIRI
ncbi:MAG: DNA translocase FtsK, partial [Candidatus Levybacteria bacterium]|nr:DNA translocase FtsK [Candidatus Levybacteria bacterium]